MYTARPSSYAALQKNAKFPRTTKVVLNGTKEKRQPCGCIQSGSDRTRELAKI